MARTSRDVTPFLLDEVGWGREHGPRRSSTEQGLAWGAPLHCSLAGCQAGA